MEDYHSNGELLSSANQILYNTSLQQPNIKNKVLQRSFTEKRKLIRNISEIKMQRVEKNQIEIKHAKVVRIRKMADLEKCSTPVKTPILSTSTIFEASTITGSPIKLPVSTGISDDITISSEQSLSSPPKPAVRRALDLDSLPMKRRQSLGPDAFNRRRSNLVRASGTSRDHKSLSKWLDKREYECDLCGIRFFHESAVRAHKLTHTGGTINGTLPRTQLRSVKRAREREASDKSEDENSLQCNLYQDDRSIFGSLTSLRMPKKAKLMAKIKRISFFKPTIKTLKS